MKRTYECMVLLDNREVRNGWSGLKDKVGGMFTKHGAAVVSARLWEERRLAYPIKRQKRGTYLLVYFNSETEAITSIRRDLELSESVMRHMVLACESVPETAFEPEAAFDSSAVEIEDVTVQKVVSSAEEKPAPEDQAKPDEGESTAESTAKSTAKSADDKEKPEEAGDSEVKKPVATGEKASGAGGAGTKEEE